MSTDRQRTTLTDAAAGLFDAFGHTLPAGVRDWTQKVDVAMVEKLNEQKAKQATAESTEDTEIGPIAVVRASKLRPGDTVYVKDCWVEVASADESPIMLGRTVELVVHNTRAPFPVRVRHVVPAARLMMIRPRRP